ncbi:MAG: ABC transporter substrate-binding protein [Candidatus Brachytrichaceae bacterium NZ_4S206]|jgi:ABC-type transport system substrate-binding protein
MSHDSKIGHGRIVSRRNLLKGMGVASGALLLSACAPAAQPGAPSNPTPAGTIAPTADAPAAASVGSKRRGGTFRLAHSEDFTTLDVARAYGYVDWWASSFLLYDRLYVYDNDLNLIPNLAAGKPEISADGLRVTIPLKQGVKFHDGSEMKAEDVKFSIERSLLPTIASAAGYFDNVTGAVDFTAGKAEEVAGIIAKDDYTLEINLVAPQPTLIPNLAVSVVGVAPKKAIQAAGEDWGTKVVIGTGPYRLVEWKAGEKITFERFAGHHLPDKGFVDRIEIFQNVAPQQSVLRWESGELDYVVDYPAAELARIQSDDTLKQRLVSGPTTIVHYLTLRNSPPLDDLNFRKAMAYAIDKQAIADKLRTAVPLNRLYPDVMTSIDKDFQGAYSYDPEKAKAALSESKYKDNPKVSMWAFANSEVAPLIQADFEAVGIQLEILQGDYGAFQPRFDTGEVQMNMNGWSSDVIDPAPFMVDRILCRPNAAKVQFCDPFVAETYEKVRALPLDSPERVVGFRQLEDYIVNQQVQRIPLYQVIAIGLSQDHVKDAVIHPIFGLPDPQLLWMDK